MSVKICVYEVKDRSVPVEMMCDRAVWVVDTIKGIYDQYIAVYDDKTRDILLREQAITDAMETALSEKQFIVYYQPKNSLNDDGMAGAEALVRWIHPEWGFMSPGEFIPLFEKNGFIRRLDEYVWESVCEKLREWKDKGYEIVPVSVNVSRADIYQSDLVETFTKLIEKYDMQRKTDTEMQGAYALLKKTLHFFIEKSYHVWKTNNDLKGTPAQKDKVLSQITQIMYSYNLTVDIATGNYSLITGTGMERTVEEYKRHSNQSELTAFQESIMHPSYLSRFNELVNFDSAKIDPTENGFRGTFEYPVIYPGDDEFEWHEINVFINTEDDGTRIANILGRDVTEAHKAQEKNEKELRAAADKNRILSELTKMLYSYNVTLNLCTGKYSIIIGTGMTKFMEIFKSTDDYETAYNNLTVNLETWKYSLITGTGMESAVEIMQHNDDYVLLIAKLAKNIAPESKDKAEELMGVRALKEKSNTTGYVGSLSYRVIIDNQDRWSEVNLFIGTNEDGVPVANILGHDITEAHEQQEAKERELKASAAKDQILSDITKTLYSYNATVNLNTGKYSLIVGTGMEELIRHFSQTDDFEKGCGYLLEHVLPEYVDSLNEGFSLEALRRQQNLSGHIGQMEYAAVTENGIGWFEINAFMGVDEEGNPTANILGRDITETHEAQLRRENELKAVAAKDQILSDITKTLYSYNLPLNLVSGKYSLILGTGMKEFVKIFEATDDYETAYNQKKQYLTDDYIEIFGNFSSLSALRKRKNETGYLGNLEYSAKTEKGIEWHEINILLGTDENGEPIANILGRDITEAHEQQEKKERELRASAARDQLLSGVTKMLYSYNMTVNVDTGKYTLITGTGLEETVAKMESTDDYEDIYRSFINSVDETYLKKGCGAS